MTCKHLLTKTEKLLSELFIIILLSTISVCTKSYNEPWVNDIFNPRGINGRIVVELHMTLLHTKYTRFVSCGFRDFYYKPMTDNDTLWRGLYGPQESIKRSTMQHYTQNMMIPGLLPFLTLEAWLAGFM